MNCQSALLLAVVFFAGCQAQALAVSVDFLTNGGVEQGQGTAPAGWSLSWWPLVQPAPALPPVESCIARSQERTHSGQWSLRLETAPALGKEAVLVFNGNVDAAAAKAPGGRLILTGWVYVQPGTALRPIEMRLRAFGPVAGKRTDFTGDVISTHVLGRPGMWTPFRAEGSIPRVNITGMDLHCSIQPDVAPTVQFLDDIRVEAPEQPPFSVSPLGATFWRDSLAIPVDIRLPESNPADAIDIRLESPSGKVAAHWREQASQGVGGLNLPRRLLPEGLYRLHAEQVRGGHTEATAGDSQVELVTSPWEDAPRFRAQAPASPATWSLPAPQLPSSLAEGTAAPTQLPDAAPQNQAGEVESSDFQPQRGLEAQATVPGVRPAPWVAFVPPAFESISRARLPYPGEEGRVRLVGCPEEYVSAAVGVRTRQPLHHLSMTIGEFRTPSGQPTPAAADVRLVRTIKGLPPFLEHRSGVEAPANQTKEFWLTVYPKDTAPGYYQAALTISADGCAPEAIPVLLRVLPLKLPPPAKGYGFWWALDARWNGYYSKAPAEALGQVRKQFILLHEYGCNMISMPTIPQFTRSADGRLQFDFSRDLFGYHVPFADLYRMGKVTGFFNPAVPLQYDGAEELRVYGDSYAKVDRSSPAFAEFYQTVCKRIDDWARQQGIPLAFACVDEIGNSPDRREEALRFYKLAAQQGVLTSVTDNSTGGGTFLTAQPRFSSITRLRLFDFLWPEMIRETRETGGTPWAYNIGSDAWNPLQDRLAFGLYTERIGVEGCVQWAFQWPDGNQSPYEAAAAGKFTGYHYALPSPDGPLPTLGLEAVREGIDDARYLALARQKAPHSPVVSLDEIPGESLRMGDFLHGHSAGWFEIKRWQIAREAMR